MADFCWHCTEKYFSPEVKPQENDFRDKKLRPGEKQWAVCEGCGAGWFDRDGKRVGVAQKNVFAHQLEKLFQHKGISEAVIASRTGFSTTLLASYRTGQESNPDYETLRKLARAFEVHPGYFFEDDASLDAR